MASSLPDPRGWPAVQAASLRTALVTYAFGIVRDWALAEDAVQDALLIACRKWSDDRTETLIFPWLRGIARLECLRLLRERRREQPVEQTALEELIQRHWEHVWDEPDAGYLARRVYALRQCMAQLPKGVQQLLHDFYIRRASAQDVLSASGAEDPEDTDALRSQLYRVRNRLRRCVRQRTNEMVSQDSEALDRLLEEYLTGGEAEGRAGWTDADLAALESAPMDALLREALQDWRTLLLALVESAETEAFQPAEWESPPVLAPLAQPARPSIPAARPRVRAMVRPAPRKSFPWEWAAAAVFLTLAGWGAWAWQAQSWGKVEFSVTGGEAFLTRWGWQRTVRAEGRLRAGDALRIADNAVCQLRWPDDGTTLRGRGPARLKLTERKDGAKQLELLSGAIECEAARQPEGRPLRIWTPQARVTVVGTHFFVHAAAESTMVRVAHGRVEVASRGGGSKLADVAAGEFATVRPGLLEKRSLGSVRQDIWMDLPGNDIWRVLSHPHLQDPPTQSQSLTRLHFGPTPMENYLARIRGILHPPKDGYYRFRIAADNAGELRLELPPGGGRQTQVAEVPEYVGLGQWDAYPQQTSAPVYLRAGVAYPFEIVHKQGVHTGFVTVEWERPGEPFAVIDGEFLSPP